MESKNQYRRQRMQVKRQARRDALVPPGSVVLGIDLDRDHMTCAGMQLGCKQPWVECKPRRDLAGVGQLVADTKRLCHQRFGHTRVVFAMEATAGYWIPVAMRLHSLGERYVLVSTRSVAKSRCLDDGRRQASDPKDARRIAELALQGHVLFLQLHELSQDQVKWYGYACEYYDLTEAITAQRNRIHAWLDIVRPELGKAISDITGPTALAVLQVLPQIRPEWEQADFLQAVKNTYSRRRLAVGMLRRLWPLVQHPSAWGSQLHRPAYDWRLSLAAAQAALLREQLAHAERLLMQAYDASDAAELLDTIPGNPRRVTACVLGFAGDLRRFDSPRAVVKFAGLDPVQEQSGQRRGQTHVSCLGHNRLRGASYRAADWLSGLGQNPYFRTRRRMLCERKDNPLHYQAAVVACGNTYLRMITVMVQNRLTYQDYQRFVCALQPHKPASQ